LLFIICEIRWQKGGNSKVTVDELLGVLHDLWVEKHKAVVSDHLQVLNALEYMRDVLGWVEYDEREGTIEVTGEGEEEYEELKKSGWRPFLEEIEVKLK